MLEILYEDNHIIVVVKKPNIPVQEDDSKDEDLLTIIKKYLKEKYNKPGNVYLGLVHRLDRPVGGVMVFAKTSKAASRLSDMIRKKEMTKTYIALTHGYFKKEEDTLINYLEKEEDTFNAFITDEEHGKKAILDYKIISYDEEKDMTLVKINLHTGRHHQIRIQLANISHPIYGDQRYGNDEVGIQIHLWASNLSFVHPVTKEIMQFVNIPDWAKY